MKKNKFIKLLFLAAVIYFQPLTLRAQDEEAEKLMLECSKAKSEFIKKDSSMAALFASSDGYVVFPKIGKGGFIV